MDGAESAAAAPEKSSAATEVPELSVLGLPGEHLEDQGTPEIELVLLSAASLLCMVFMHWRRRSAILSALPEQHVSIVVGMVLGAATRATGFEELSETIFYSFSGVFFDFLLPAIIFSNAFGVKNKAFFRNLSGIMCFSVLGTILSTLCIGLGVYFGFESGLLKVAEYQPDDLPDLATQVDLSLNDEHEEHPPGSPFMPLVDCLILGAMMSAVDPGAVLTALPPNLDSQVYSLLFGESVLNSAVAVVLYNGFRMYHHVLVERGDMTELLPEDIQNLAYRFFAIAVLSMLTGVAFGLLSAATLRHIVALHDSPGREQAVMFLFAYLSYIAPREIGLSPVVALFFCGTTMTHYTFYNISRMSQIATSTWFKTIGHLAETFVFVFLGVSVFSVNSNEWHPGLVALLIALAVASRGLQIFSLSAVINATRWVGSHKASWTQWAPCSLVSTMWRITVGEHCCTGSSSHAPIAERPDPQYISLRVQLFLCLSGLRGAVSFALALHAPVLNQEGEMVTTMISVILFTYVVQGAALSWAAEGLGLVDEIDKSLLDDHEKERLMSVGSIETPLRIMQMGLSPRTSAAAYYSHRCNSYDSAEGNTGSAGYGTFASSWRQIDENYLKPVFGGRGWTLGQRRESEITNGNVSPRHGRPSLESLGSHRGNFFDEETGMIGESAAASPLGNATRLVL